MRWLRKVIGRRSTSRDFTLHVHFSPSGRLVVWHECADGETFPPHTLTPDETSALCALVLGTAGPSYCNHVRGRS